MSIRDTDPGQNLDPSQKTPPKGVSKTGLAVFDGRPCFNRKRH